jgi:hypothetical protein
MDRWMDGWLDGWMERAQTNVVMWGRGEKQIMTIFHSIEINKNK